MNIQHPTSNIQHPILWLLLALFSILYPPSSAFGYPPAPASQAQVNAGTEPYLYVTPKTLAGANAAAGVVTNVTWESFGMVGDGIKLSDCYTTSNSASVTSFSASFSSADIGKTAFIYNDITNITYSLGTVIAVNSATNITLSTNVLRTWSGTGQLIYGHNNYLAMSNMIASASIAGTYKFLADNGVYLVCGPLFNYSSANAMFKLHQEATETGIGGSVTFEGRKNVITFPSSHIPALLSGVSVYFLSTSARTPTNTIFLDESPINNGSIWHFFKNINFYYPADPAFGVYYGRWGGVSFWEQCGFLVDQSTNTDVSNTHVLYEPPAYRENTNAIRTIVLPGAQNVFSGNFDKCTFIGSPIAISSHEHGKINRCLFDFCGTAILAGEFGVGADIQGFDDYAIRCKNFLAMANTAPINYEPIHFDHIGIETSGQLISTIDDPAGLFSGYFSTYNYPVTNLTSPNLAVVYESFNGATSFLFPQASSANFIGNGPSITNLNFSNISSNTGSWSVPQTVTLSHVGGGWTLDKNNTFNCQDAITVNSGSSAKPYMQVKFGSQIFNVQFRRTSDGAPTISDLGNAASVILWQTNGNALITGSTDGSTTYQVRLGPNGSFSGGISSFASNTLALASITFPASNVNWTNTTGRNIFVLLDNTAITGTAIKINGTQVSSSLTGGVNTIPLQPGEYFSETYTVGTPTAVIKPE